MEAQPQLSQPAEAQPHNPPPSLPPESPPQDSPPDAEGLAGPSKEVVAAKQAAAEAKRKAILESARAAMRAEFRKSQGLPAPEPASEAPPAGQEAPASNPALASPSPSASPAPNPNTGAIAQAITAELQKQFRDAEALRAEAAAMQAEAQRKVQEAEAKVAAWQQNPVAYLEAQGLSPDEWQARLLNGGEPTPEEKLRQELLGKVNPVVDELKQEIATLRAQQYAAQRTKVVEELTPILAKDFPIVNKLLGPDGTLKHLESLRDKTKERIDPQQTIAALEARFLQQYQETLQDPAVASKVMPSVTKSPPAEVVAQSPQTLTNRVTSTVPSAKSRPMTEQERIARGREAIRKLLAAGQL